MREGVSGQMQISNIQENLSKTELIQRLQQIMQDASRAAQDVQTPMGAERSRIAQEQVETTQETENEIVRREAGRHQQRQRRGKKTPAQDQNEPAQKLKDHLPPRLEGRIIDITV